MAYYFVYGTLKKGFHNHYLLEKAKFIGNTTTPPNYTMLSMGGYPGIISGGKTSISGEIYEVSDPNIIDAIHRLEGYKGPNQANWYELETVETPLGKANIFVLNESYKKSTNPIVETGIWKLHKRF